MSASARAREEGSWEVITAALDRTVGPGRPSGAWTKYCCPAHEADGRGHKPSLGVKYDSHAQRTVVRCFAGCDNEIVLDSLGLKVRDMFDRKIERTPGGGQDRRANRSRPRPLSPSDRALDAAGMPRQQAKKTDLGEQVSAWKTTATYPYLAADGTVIGEVVRREADFERGRDKDFRQRHWNSQTGRMEAGGFAPVPYRLPQVRDAIAEGRTVYICEGEKDVAAAESAGLTATTNSGGAAGWSAEHAQWLDGAATVVIVADRDPAGYRRAERIMATLSGRVARVRVVQAATGKDLHDHLQCGHEIAELVPIPHLDPLTPTSAAAVSPAAAHIPPASPPAAAATGPDITHPHNPGDTNMPEYLLAPALHDAPPPSHSDEVDHIGGQMSMFLKLFLTYYMEHAKRVAEQHKLRAQRARDEAEDERAATAARYAAEKAAVEAELVKLTDAGFDNASRTEIAAAMADAAGWMFESDVAEEAAHQLAGHIKHRFGIDIDVINYDLAEPEIVVPPDLAEALIVAEQERAGRSRLRKAQDRMVEVVAAEGLDESVKAELFAAIEAWRTDPTAKRLDALTRTLEEKGVGQTTRTKVRFVAAYLGTPGQMVPVEQLGEVDSASATRELRKLGEPLVDPGEEVKARTDRMLVSYQDTVRTGGPTASLRARLGEAISVMTPEDQAAVRERGAAIRTNPGEKFGPLWPDHVDRDELATTVRVYAVLAPQAELLAGKAGDLGDADARALQERAAKHRREIVTAIKGGKGLHEWERDQLALVMRDIEAGKTTAPELMFADDRSGAAADADRAMRIAQSTSTVHRRQLEDILDTKAVPAGTVRRSRDTVTRVIGAQTELAAGRASLSDYENSGLDRQLDAQLTAVGVPEPIRNKVRAHLDNAAGEAAIVGKQATTIADRWDARREAIVTARQPSAPAPGYDSPERRQGLADHLRATGLDEDQLAQRMAADAGHATPASAAPKAGHTRRTSPGAGMSQIHHRRGKGRGPEKGLGL